MLVFHFSKFILLIAHFSCRGIQNAACTTAVAPTPAINNIYIKYIILYTQYFEKKKKNFILKYE